MENYFVVLFKHWEHGRVYDGLSNFYFKTEDDARAYAQELIEHSEIFSEFEIRQIMPY